MTIHKPVLLKEVIEYLSPKPNENFIDATINGGGHTAAILQKNKPRGKVLGIEINFDSYNELKNRLKEFPNPDSPAGKRLILVNDNFINLKKIVEKYNFKNIAGILFDLGLSSDLLEKSGKGFSFKKDEFLDMRYGNKGTTACEIINHYSEEELERILKEYGEEKLTKSIVKNIIERRKKEEIKTTKQLIEVIDQVLKKFKVYNFKLKVKTFARVFQALRIAVNDELENLKKVLPQTLEVLLPKGKLVVISYHSLEDRIVKNFFREKEKEGFLKILTKKPTTPTKEEIRNNPRSRSAKLRAAVKL